MQFLWTLLSLVGLYTLKQVSYSQDSKGYFWLTKIPTKLYNCKRWNIWNFSNKIILKPLHLMKYLIRHNKFGKPNSNDGHAYSYWNSTDIWPVETNFEIVRLYSKKYQDRLTFRLWGKTLWISRIDGLIWSLLSL